MTEKRFAIAGVDVSVRAEAGSLDHMLGYYDAYPASGAAPLAIANVRIDPEFHIGRVRGPSYPGFEPTPLTPGVTRFSRYDAEGTLDVSGEIVRADFIVGASPNSLEAAVRIAVSAALPRASAVIFHASATADERGLAQLFLGVSGRGKSTIAELLAQAGETKVSDELVIVKRTAGGAEAIVSPFIGSMGLPHGRSFPLGALNLLVQSPEHSRRRVDHAEALPQLLRHAVAFAREPATVEKVMDVLLGLLSDIPCFELHFAKRQDVRDAILLT